MSTWWDVWHMALAIVARQPPFGQIMVATGAVFVVVMALEGIRTSLLAIWRAHKAVPSLAAPPTATTTHIMAAPLSKSLAASASSRFAAAASRRPKPLTLSPRQFRSPRPKIRRHGLLQWESVNHPPQIRANSPFDLRETL